jgi:cytidylate kinase
MKKKIITIAGKPGSGKSTTSKKLCGKLGYERFSSGDFFREVGLKRGLDLATLSSLAEKDKSIDELTDQKVREMGEKENIIVESRLAFHWIPDSFKVYLDLDLKTCAERMFKDLEINPIRKESEHCDSLEEMERKLAARFESEKKRYREMYGIDPQDLSQYDLVINTSENSVENVSTQIESAYKAWLGL